MWEVGSWIRRGVLHTPKNKFVTNAVGVATLGDPQCIVEMVLNVWAGPVSAQTKSLLEQFLWKQVIKIAPTICNRLHLRFRTVPFCHLTKEGQSLESFIQIPIYLISINCNFRSRIYFYSVLWQLVCHRFSFSYNFHF